MVYVILGCRLALVLVFVVSAATKVRNRGAYDAFRQSLRRLELLPPALVAPAAALTVGVEIGIVVLLAVPATTLAGFVVAAGLLAVFSGAILLSLRGGVRAPCRCFGASTRPLGPPHVARNVVLLSIAAAGTLALLDAGTAALHPAGVTIAAVAGLAVGALAVVFDDIVELFVPASGRSPSVAPRKAS